MKNIQKTVLIALFTLLSACAPRGENQSVDQVLKQQHANYISQYKTVKVSDSASGHLKSLTSALEELQSSEDKKVVGAASQGIADNLSELLLKAGFTSRPAMTELLNQYRVISQQPDNANSASVKLLLARTYSALASELETTKFEL